MHCISGLYLLDTRSTHTLSAVKNNHSSHWQKVPPIKNYSSKWFLTMDVSENTEVPWHGFRTALSASLGEKPRFILTVSSSDSFDQHAHWSPIFGVVPLDMYVNVYLLSSWSQRNHWLGSFLLQLFKSCQVIRNK